MVRFDFPSKRQGAWGKLCFHLHPWDRARSSITWSPKHFHPYSPTVFKTRLFWGLRLSKNYLEIPALQGAFNILQGKAVPMPFMSSSSTAVLLVQRPHFEWIWPQQSFFPTICKHLLLYSLWNNNGSPEILTSDKGTKEITTRRPYLCDNEQKEYCKFLPLFFQEYLGNFSFLFFNFLFPPKAIQIFELVRTAWGKKNKTGMKVRPVREGKSSLSNPPVQHTSLSGLQCALLAILFIWILEHMDFQFIKRLNTRKILALVFCPWK